MNNPTQKFIDSILKATGEYYREAMSQKIKDGIKKAKAQGKNVYTKG